MFRTDVEASVWPFVDFEDTYLLTYLSPWLLLEHRPCTTSLQRLLSWAILSSCFQLSPVCVMSASKSRRQVFFGLPLFRLPWGPRQGLSRNVGFGFLNVWPSHLHLLLRMSISICTWLVLSQRSLLLTLSIHCIPNFSASTDLQKSGSCSAWSCSFAKFLLRIAIQT